MEKIAVELDRVDVMNMIKGMPIPFGGNEHINDTRYIGNQWWEWNLKTFEDLSLDELLAKYQMFKRDLNISDCACS
jgi:hypothetical protein